jgi:hypothetical protein
LHQLRAKAAVTLPHDPPPGKLGQRCDADANRSRADLICGPFNRHLCDGMIGRKRIHDLPRNRIYAPIND